MPNSLHLKHAGIVRSTANAHLVEVSIAWTVKTGTKKSPKISKGTKPYSIWIHRSQLTKTLEGEIYVSEQLIRKEEKEVAEKLAYTTVEILTLEPTEE